MSLIIAASLWACGTQAPAAGSSQSGASGAVSTAASSSGEDKNSAAGGVMVLFTSDVHCGVDQGFGYAGLAFIRDNLKDQGYATILVDDGDFIQGETIGTVDKGESIINLMNDMEYDVAVPGNHEFDYGMDRFM
ncbi:MAG: metallophosphoesterase [Lachnospiraceae bacterium]|nr:metallophosphoesterase [Lachnospiraceae bacterium]